MEEIGFCFQKLNETSMDLKMMWKEQHFIENLAVHLIENRISTVESLKIRIQSLIK